MTEFKIGDKVRAIHTDYPYNFPLGSTGIVSNVIFSFDDGTIAGYDVINDDIDDPYGWFFLPNELELVADAL